jgi:hypothetical protein
MSTPMPCGNTAALAAKTMSDRDATAAELAEREQLIVAASISKLSSPHFICEAISEMPEFLIKELGMRAILLKTDAVSKRIREYAIKCAKQELGL